MNNLMLDKGEEFTSYNVQEFANKDVNILLMTGYSGSGKSTLAERLAFKYDLTHIELNEIDPKYETDYNEDGKYKNEIFYEFFEEYPDLNKPSTDYEYRKELPKTLVGKINYKELEKENQK